MEIANIILSAFITVFSLGLLIIALKSYKEFKNIKLLFVSFVLLIFYIKGIFLSFNLLNNSDLTSNFIFYTELFDVTVLILLFAATLKR